MNTTASAADELERAERTQKANEEEAKTQEKERFMVYVSLSATGLVGSVEPDHNGKDTQIVPVEQVALLLKEINSPYMSYMQRNVMVTVDGWHMFLGIEASEVRKWSRLIYGTNTPKTTAR